MTPEDMADLAESLVPAAGRLIAAVRDDGPSVVARMLADVPASHLPALCVVLAAHADPDVSSAEALAWVPTVTAARVPDDTLFGPVFDEDHDGELPRILRAASIFPQSWPDEECRALHRAWRARTRARTRRLPEPEGDPEREQAGWREWEARRKADQRAPAEPVVADAGAEGLVAEVTNGKPRGDGTRRGGPVTRAAAARIAAQHGTGAAVSTRVPSSHGRPPT